MRLVIFGTLLPVLFFSCKSIPDRVKQNKAKFIQVAQENSRPVEMENIKDLLEQAKTNDTEAKMKYLGIDNMETIYSLSGNSKLKLDSVVVFKKSNYNIIYDFAKSGRNFDMIQQKSGLKDLEEIDDRLFIGRN
jgi:hypothetical protein